MLQVEGQTEEVIFDHLHATAFQYTPLGRTILGPAQNIKTITKAHLQNYIQMHYAAPRMVRVTACCRFFSIFFNLAVPSQISEKTHCFLGFQVIVASGAVKHEDIVEEVKKLFCKLSSDPTTASQLVEKEPAVFTGSEVGE